MTTTSNTSAILRFAGVMAPPPPPPPPFPPTAATAQRAMFFSPAAVDASPLAVPPPLPADAIDENLLLAETEELLAALDATAFVSSPASTEDDNEEEDDEEQVDGLRAVPPPAVAQAAAQAQMTTTTTTLAKTAGKKRVRSRDRTKDELLELRRSVVDLEKHLVALRRNTTVVGKGKRNVTQTWEHIARRQLRGRERAEQENQQLKAMLLGQLSLAGRLDQTSNKRQLVAFPDSSSSPQSERACPANHLTNTAVMDALISAIDGAYAQMDAVFKENEMDWRLEPRAYAQTKTRVSSETGEESSYLELVEVRLIPFHVKAVGDYLWQTMRSWHQKNSSYSFPCSDRPSDTFAVSYRVESRLGLEQDKYSAAYKLVKRRYVRSGDEVVVVWKSRSDGDKALAGFHTDEVGWVVVTAVPSVDASEPPMTALRACVQICPQKTDEDRSSSTAASCDDSGKPSSADSRSLLTDLIVDSFENDVNSINQAMENLLMDDLRRPLGDPGGGSVTSSADSEAGFATAELKTSERIHFAAL